MWGIAAGGLAWCAGSQSLSRFRRIGVGRDGAVRRHGRGARKGAAPAELHRCAAHLPARSTRSRGRRRSSHGGDGEAQPEPVPPAQRSLPRRSVVRHSVACRKSAPRPRPTAPTDPSLLGGHGMNGTRLARWLGSPQPRDVSRTVTSPEGERFVIEVWSPLAEASSVPLVDLLQVAFHALFGWTLAIKRSPVRPLRPGWCVHRERHRSRRIALERLDHCARAISDGSMTFGRSSPPGVVYGG